MGERQHSNNQLLTPSTDEALKFYACNGADTCAVKLFVAGVLQAVGAQPSVAHAAVLSPMQLRGRLHRNAMQALAASSKQHTTTAMHRTAHAYHTYCSGCTGTACHQSIMFWIILQFNQQSSLRSGVHSTPHGSKLGSAECPLKVGYTANLPWAALLPFPPRQCYCTTVLGIRNALERVRLAEARQGVQPVKVVQPMQNCAMPSACSSDRSCSTSLGPILNFCTEIRNRCKYLYLV